MAKGPEARRGRRGLRRLPAELIAEAQDQTAVAISRTMLTFVGLTIFCLLALLTPDVALLTGSERLNVPFTGPVSFRGFMVLGPALLIALRIYLQIYVEHWRRLESIGQRMSIRRAPTLAPLQNPILRRFVETVLYLLLPLTMVFFTYKAAVLPIWGSYLLVVTAMVVARHLMLELHRSWELKGLMSVGLGILVTATVYPHGPFSRPWNLFREDLSHAWLPGKYLRGAELRHATLEGANLIGADLGRAKLEDATLEDAALRGAILIGANLNGADLARANLDSANLENAVLRRADLESANLGGANLVGANLVAANLAGAILKGAILEGAELRVARLRSAHLGSADLGSADLWSANLESAYLGDANLVGADLRGADLSGADLSGADLASTRGLDQDKLDKACGDETTKLPEGLSIGPCAQEREPD